MKLSSVSYFLKCARSAAVLDVTDKTALASILHRLDNLEAFVEYLRNETFTPRRLTDEVPL